MANSPLELYEAAYRLHYADNRIPDALRYYDAIIREFPNSNECGYAVIQINKIKANSAAAAIAPKRKGGVLAIISLILCLLILGALGTGGYLAYEYLLPQAQNAEKRMSLAARALGKIVDGRSAEALELLDEMKELSDADITPYELSAQIYHRGGSIDQARAEYEAFFAKNPSERAKYRPVEELIPEPASAAALPAARKRGQ